MAIPFSFFGFGISFFFSGFRALGSILFLLIVGLTSAAFVGHLVGFHGLWRNYGSMMGLATFVYGLVAVGFLVAVTASLSDLNLSFEFLTYAVISIVLIGVMFILEGTTYIVKRYYFHPGAAVAAGVLFIVAGGFFCSILLQFVGASLSMPALIIGGILLVKAPVPALYSSPGMYAPPQAPPGTP